MICIIGMRRETNMSTIKDLCDTVFEFLLDNVHISNDSKEYLRVIQRDIERDDERKKEEIQYSDFYEKLEDLYYQYKQQLEDDENASALLVECRSARERMLIHAWANKKCMKHSACIYDDFNENCLYICKNCGTGRYEDKINMHADYSTISPGSIYGYYWRCEGCDDAHHTDYDCEDREYIIKKFYNCVIVSPHLPNKIGKKVEINRTKKNKSINNRRKQLDNKIQDLREEINTTFIYKRMRYIRLTEEEKNKINGCSLQC